MRTISYETYMLMTDELSLNHARIEYTPLRDPKPDDLILVIKNPGKEVLDIMTKMESKSYKFIPQENGDKFVNIYHKTLPEFEQCKLLTAACEDEGNYVNECSYGEVKPEVTTT